MIKGRIVELVEYKGFVKENFYKKIGMTSASFRGKAKETPINSTAIENILSEVPEVSLEWLLTGRGNMLKGDEMDSYSTESIISTRKTKDAVYEMQRVPLFNLEATLGLIPLMNNGNDELVIDYLSIPNLPACDGAMYATGDSMYPLLKSGDIVAFKKVDPTNLFYGEMYIISVFLDESNTYKTVKFVHKSELGDDYIKLVSQNQHHSSRDIRLSQIAAIGLVRASIRIHG